jgi:hypothetical protein
MVAFGGYCEDCGRRTSDGVMSVCGRQMVCIPCAVDDHVSSSYSSTGGGSPAPFDHSELAYSMTGVHPTLQTIC